MRILLLSMWLLAQAGTAAADVQTPVGEQWGDNSARFLFIDQVRRTPLDYRGEIETRLLSVLDDLENGIAVVNAVCESLRLVASERSIPAMSRLLLDDDMAIHALKVLQAIDSREADAALRQALAEVTPSVRTAIAMTLGIRRDRLAVDPIAVVLAETDDADLRKAALHALGRIGTVDALRVLDEVEVAPDERQTRDQAALECAYSLLGAGSGDPARTTFMDLSEQGATPAVRTGALRGLLLSVPEQALEPLRTALTDTNPTVSIGAAMVSRVASDSGVTHVLTNALTSASPPLQAALIGALADRQDPAAAPAVLALLESEHPAVRDQVIYASEWIGGPDLLEPLLALAQDESATRDAARFVLSRIPSADMTSGIEARLDEEGADVGLLLELLDRRGAPPDLPRLMAIAERGDPEMRAAMNVMSRRTGTNDVSTLLDWMNRVPEDDRTRVAGVILDATEDLRDPDSRYAMIFDNADTLTDATRAQLIAVAPRIGGPAALAALEEAAAGNDATIQDAALRALCKWSAPEAITPLNRVLDRTSDERQRILIYRSLVSLIREHVEPQQQQVTLLEQLSDTARLPAEEAVIDAALKAMGGSSPP